MVGELDGAAETVDAVVGLLGGEALQGLLDEVAFLLDEVVEPARREEISRRFEGGVGRVPIESRRFGCAYLKPSLRWPAALAYQLAKGTAMDLRKGRARIPSASCL